MVKRLIPVFLVPVLSIILITGCKKEEGEGGTSSISGKVFAIDYNSNFSLIKSRYYAPDEDVFIVYGNNEVYNDKMSTHYNGSFRFDNLRKGSYEIYVYSDDSTMTYGSEIFPVIYKVEITSNKQNIVIPDLIIAK